MTLWLKLWQKFWNSCKNNPPQNAFYTSLGEALIGGFVWVFIMFLGFIVLLGAKGAYLILLPIGLLFSLSFALFPLCYPMSILTDRKKKKTLLERTQSTTKIPGNVWYGIVIALPVIGMISATALVYITMDYLTHYFSGTVEGAERFTAPGKQMLFVQTPEKYVIWVENKWWYKAKEIIVKVENVKNGEMRSFTFITNPSKQAQQAYDTYRYHVGEIDFPKGQYNLSIQGRFTPSVFLIRPAFHRRMLINFLWAMLSIAISLIITQKLYFNVFDNDL